MIRQAAKDDLDLFSVVGTATEFLYPHDGGERFTYDASNIYSVSKMSHSHQWEPDGVHLKVWGETSKAEIDEAIGLIRNSPELPKLNYVIADYLDVEGFTVSDYDTLIIAAHDHWCRRAFKTTQLCALNFTQGL